jgi:Hemerythrin HHE cation binding domain
VASDMEFMNRLFHGALRRDLKRASSALTSARQPTPAQRVALSEHLGLMLDLLHHHHTGEDTGLWPLVRDRAPDLAAQLDMMEAEHSLVAGAIVSARAAARQYAATATDISAARRRLHAALTDLGRALLPHVDHEETEVMPRVMRALTPHDWSLLSRRELRNWKCLTLVGTGLVWMADGLEHTERVKFNQQVSMVVRWLVDKRYGGAYRRRTALAFGLTDGATAGHA